MNFRYQRASIAPALTAVAWLLCGLPGPAAAQQWVDVEVADRPITVTASGIVMPAEALRFGPPPSRNWRLTITKLAREGSRVKAGDVLAQFDASATDDRAAKSESEKAARKADTDASLYASLEYRKLVEEKVVALALYQGELERVTLVARVREAKRAELEAEIRRLESELQGARTELESFTIRAPRDGLVIVGTNRQGQKLDVNESVNPGIMVVELANEESLIIQAEVPEFVAASIAVGQAVSIAIDAAGSSELQAEVTEVASIVRRQSRYSQAMIRDVIVSLPQEVVSDLRPGMSAKLEIVVDIQQRVLAVPNESIQYRDGRPGVEVRGGGWQPVSLGRASAGMRVVEDGLEPGDEVRL
jgi:RND family efflux transporter MFP subunit